MQEVTPSPLLSASEISRDASEAAGETEHEQPDLALTQEEWSDDLALARKLARVKGYEGDPCGECGQFTLVRGGTCLRCVSCGATSGCS